MSAAELKGPPRVPRSTGPGSDSADATPPTSMRPITKLVFMALHCHAHSDGATVPSAIKMEIFVSFDLQKTRACDGAWTGRVQAPLGASGPRARRRGRSIHPRGSRP